MNVDRNRRASGVSVASEDYIERSTLRFSHEAPIETAVRIASLTAEHDRWRAKGCLNMNAAEGLMSLGARRLLASDLATRVTEGAPGDKVFPHRYQNRFIDEIEVTLIAVTRKLFGVRYVEWRPLSTSMANAAVFCAVAKPGDPILVQSEDAGGNYSYNPAGFPKLLGLNVVPLPYTGRYFELDVDRVREVVQRVRPRLIVVGGSNVMYPYPVRALRTLADEVGAVLLYDAAHLGLLIAAGQFQNPFVEGAHLMTISTHKIMGGAVGGMVLTNEPDLAQVISSVVFPPMLQTRDQNKYAATAYAFAEHLTFGEAHARQIIANARALGIALEEAGFEVFGDARGCTLTHQVFCRHPDVSDVEFEDRCQASDILAARTRRTVGVLGGRPGGVIRLSVQELTRQGFVEHDMRAVAGLIRDAAEFRKEPAEISHIISEWVSTFGPIRFSFDDRLVGSDPVSIHTPPEASAP